MRKVIGTYSSVYGTVEAKEEEGTLYLEGWSKYVLVPLSETSFYRADDEDTEVHFEKPDEQGNATRLQSDPAFLLVHGGEKTASVPI